MVACRASNSVRHLAAVGSPCHISTGDWAHPCHVCTGTGLTPATSAPGLGSTPATAAPATGLTPATAALGLGSPLPQLHRDWAHPRHICTGTGLGAALSYRNKPEFTIGRDDEKRACVGFLLGRFGALSGSGLKWERAQVGAGPSGSGPASAFCSEGSAPLSTVPGVAVRSIPCAAARNCRALRATPFN